LKLATIGLTRNGEINESNKKIASIALLTATVWGANAFAHSSALEPKHGGVVKEAHDMLFELVRQEKSVSLYISDHGEDYPATELVAHVVVLAGKEKSEASFNYQQQSLLAS
jgi:hypothetical protein|tara:strand:+ start:557 stop:892 length:336 start_codon:yes stop_codon:yes gene_type:complete